MEPLFCWRKPRMTIALQAERSLTEVRRSRSLLLLLGDEPLAELSRLRCADPFLRQQFLVESIFRLWLYPKASLERRLKLADLSNSLWDLAAEPGWPSFRVVSTWLERSWEKRGFNVPEELGHGPAQRVGGLLRKRIDTWKNAAGIIPFVGLKDDLSEAIVLPFDIRPSDQKEGRILGGDASVIKGLTASLRTADSSPSLKGARPSDIWLPDIDRITAELLEGRSAGLPLFIALRGYHQSNTLPPFALAATGILSENGLPDPLAQTAETVARKVRIAREMGIGRILVAGPVGDCEPGMDLHACHSESDLAHQLQLLDSECSQRSTVCQGGPHAIQRRLGQIDHEMASASMAPAAAKEHLQALLEALKDQSDTFSTEVLAEVRLVLAAAECHLGNPKASSTLLDQVSANQSVLGEFSRTRALIRQAVNLIDFGRTREAASMLLDRLESIRRSPLGVSQRLKLELDALGTAGQALTVLGLSEPGARAKARECLTAACELARQLDTPDSPRPELPQDLCYLYQWHAFFDRTGSAAVWNEFETVTPPEHSSWDFMKRLRWLAAYRALLEGDHFEWRHFEDDLPSRDSGNHISWLYRLARKYRGALRAAAGDIEGGVDDFEEAVQLIPDSTAAPILQLLGVSVALAAARSLTAKAPETAARYRTLAREALKSDLADFHHVECSKILNAINSGSTATIITILRGFPY